MAPWNWGDAGEGGGIQPDVSLVVTESIQGKWQSLDDAKFTREFRSDFTVVDSYDGKANLDGLWVVFTKMNAPEISFPLEESAVYLQITEKGTPQDTLTFKVVKLTPDELELIYMDRGGVLRFKSVK
jgi:RNAse (barnase) inhibitor barstar